MALTRGDLQKALVNCVVGGDCRLCPGEIRRWKPCRDRLHILAAYALNTVPDGEIFPPQARIDDQGIGYFTNAELGIMNHQKEESDC